VLFVQVAVACAGTMQSDGTQQPPLPPEMHEPPQALNPELHMKPQLTPLHVGEELAGAVHAEHDEPQLATLVLSTHAPPHSWKPALQSKSQLPA
jgi:hypothetical protein